MNCLVVKIRLSTAQVTGKRILNRNSHLQYE